MPIGHRILVPLDGSAFAERVLPLAASIARYAEGTLRLLTVYGGWFPFRDRELAETPEAEEQRIVDQAHEYLDGLVSRLGDMSVAVETEVRPGWPDEEVVLAAGEAGCDLIAMTTHGRAGFSRLWLGSVADRVVRQAPQPILLVTAREGEEETEHRADADTGERTGFPEIAVRTVIIPLDGSELARKAIEPATRLGAAFDARYVLFRAVPPPEGMAVSKRGDLPGSTFDLAADLRTSATEALDAEAARMREDGHAVSTVVVEYQRPAAALLRLAAETPGAMIALSSHGWGDRERAILGSVSDKIVRGARCPVLLLRDGP